LKTTPTATAKLTASERAAALAWARRELAKQDFTEFCARIDPMSAHVYRLPHLRKMAEALEGVERGETPRLFITAPPRHWKSSCVSEKFPLYFLARNPEKSVGIFSHGQTLPIQFSKSVRGNIEFNPRFKELFPEIKLKEGSESVSNWSLRTAFRSSLRSFGVGAGPTGEGFDLIIIDDPIADAAEAYSPTVLASIWTWYQETLRDRLNPGGVIVLVMSRWHEDDLAGKLLKASKEGDGEPWVELKLPAIAEENDVLGRAVGEALWPDKWPLSALEAVKKGQGSRAFAARFQGSPRALEGNILDSRKLKMIEPDKVPPMDQIVRAWDLAFSERQGADYVAGAKIGVDRPGNRYILNLKRIHGRWTSSKPQIIDTAEADGVAVIVSIEANGTQLGYFQDIEVDPRMANRTVVADKPEGTKEMRASVWGSRLDDGIIYCVRAPWNEWLFEQMDAFPNTDHDDGVDAISAGMAKIGWRGAGGTKVVEPKDPSRRPMDFRARRGKALM
jgi:predicted phage terminase large subunit-like protein